MKSLIMSVLTVFAVNALAQPECTNACKVGLINAEFESAYHSGASSTWVAEIVINACGDKPAITRSCEQLINRDEGTITYAYYAGCVLDKYKKDCEQRYEDNRPR